MLKALKLWLIIMILGIALTAGCHKNSPGEEIAAPDFHLKSPEGSALSLSALRGRPVLLNFWATWCPPCRAEMPLLQQVYNDPAWQARGLVILAVDLKESGEDVSKFMAENSLSFTALLDTTGAIGDLYNIRSVPTTYIIDKDGIIKNVRIGAFASKAQIDQILTYSIIGD
jgi:thiol-disulfide isomerase/thioredoxin